MNKVKEVILILLVTAIWVIFLVNSIDRIGLKQENAWEGIEILGEIVAVCLCLFLLASTIKRKNNE